MAYKSKATTSVETQEETNIEINEVKIENEVPKVENKKPVIKFADDDFVTLKNNVCGQLYYLNKRTGDNYEWDRYGSKQDVKISDLREMKTSQRNFYTKNKFSIIGVPSVDDATPEDVIKFLNLEQYFTQDLCPDLDEVIFKWSIEDIIEKVPKMSRGSKETLIVLCNTYIENDTLDSRKKISAFETALKCELNK